MRLLGLGMVLFLAACSKPSDASAKNDATGQSTATVPPKIDYNRVDSPALLSTELRGLWAPSLKACSDPDSDSRFAIGANWIGTYESYGRLQISTNGATSAAGSKAIVSQFAMAGEGTTWDAEITMEWKGNSPQSIILSESVTEGAGSGQEAPKPQQLLRCPASSR